jgi:hypothetical protein
VLVIFPVQELFPLHVTLHCCPPQATFVQEPAPQVTSHVPVAVQVTPPVHVPLRRHWTLQSLPPHVIWPQVLAPVHTTWQLLASAQSTPPAHAFCPTHSTEQGMPGGQLTLGHGLVVPHETTQVPSL